MVIIDEVQGLNVEVLVNGQPLTEYDDDEETHDDTEGFRKSTTKYIEAVNDEVFIIRYTFSRTFTYKGTDLAIQVYVDGMYMASYVINIAQLQYGMTGLVNGHRYLQGTSGTKRASASPSCQLVRTEIYKSCYIELIRTQSRISHRSLRLKLFSNCNKQA